MGKSPRHRASLEQFENQEIRNTKQGTSGVLLFVFLDPNRMMYSVRMRSCTMYSKHHKSLSQGQVDMSRCFVSTLGSS